MMYGDLQQQQQPPPPQQQQPMGEFHRGMPMRQPSASSTTLQPDYLQQNPPPPPLPFEAHGDSFAAKRIRKVVHRRAVDYTSSVVRYIQMRMWQRDVRDQTVLQPTPAAVVDMLPPIAYLDNPATSFATKFVHASTNKNRCSINRVLWTPSGRRLITGSQSGEFTLWNGQSFNFEMILQAHDQAVRSMVWSHNENWMVTGDDGGSIKYWQNCMNNVKAKQSAHKESVRDLSFSGTDMKFCSCSDDTTVKIWDFARCQEERSLSGHGWDVKSVDWHPTKSLLVSGGKDNLVKLWDARIGRELCSFHGHKNTVLCVKWNQNGNWVLTSSKDQIIKLYDIRAMKEMESFRGHRKDVAALAWHPFHEEYFVSGSYDGSIFHWLVGNETPQIEMSGAHDSSLWDLAWHPIGYILCSGSNDYTTKFWCRNRPGDPCRDKFPGYSQGYGEQSNVSFSTGFPLPEGPTTPGPFAPGLTRNEGTIPGVGAAMPLSHPSLDTSAQEQRQPLPGTLPIGAPPLPPGPHPSVLAAGQQQAFLQFSSQVPPQPQQQQLGHPQQMVSLPLQPPNITQLQPPSHLPLLPHPHFIRPPPPQPPPPVMPATVPSSMPGSIPMPSPMPTSLPMQMPGPMGIQSSTNQMIPPMPPAHMMGMDQMHSGPHNSSSIPPTMGGFSNGMANTQGLPSAPPNYQFGGAFGRPQAGQYGPAPGLNPFQSGNLVMDVRGNSMGMGNNMGPPVGPTPPLPPPGPPPMSHGSAPK